MRKGRGRGDGRGGAGEREKGRDRRDGGSPGGRDMQACLESFHSLYGHSLTYNSINPLEGREVAVYSGTAFVGSLSVEHTSKHHCTPHF